MSSGARSWRVLLFVVIANSLSGCGGTSHDDFFAPVPTGSGAGTTNGCGQYDAGARGGGSPGSSASTTAATSGGSGGNGGGSTIVAGSGGVPATTAGGAGGGVAKDGGSGGMGNQEPVDASI